MKFIELHKKSSKDLNIELINLLREKFNLKMQVNHGKVQKSHFLKNVRRNIIWIKTILTQRNNKKYESKK